MDMSPTPGLERIPPRFVDPAMEARYRATEDGKCVRILRYGALAGIGIFVLIAAVLQFLVPTHLLVTAPKPEVMLLASLVLLMGVGVTFAPFFTRYPQQSVAVLAILVSVGAAAAMRALPADFVANRGFVLLLLHVFSIYTLFRLRILHAILAGWLSLALYGLLLLAWNVIEPAAIARHAFWLGIGNIWGMWICHQLEMGSRREFAATAGLEHERARSEKLLLNILPAAIAARLKDSHEPIAEHHGAVTVLFADIVGFTPLSARSTPANLVRMLDDVFTRFDTLASEHGLEKIKTIGDAYMAVAGLPQEQPDHALRAARMAVAMVRTVRDAAAQLGETLELRVGLHTGPVVAGVIGRSKFSYDLWGDTVNTASRMESSGLPNLVHCSPATAAFLSTEFALEARGSIDVKGKGPMETFLLAADPG